MKNKEILKINKDNYEKMYKNKKIFLRYPDNWLIGFYNSYLKKNLPTGKVLDYGFGSGNNSTYLIGRGYDVCGVEVAESSLNLLKQNLKDINFKNDISGKFLIVSPDNITLPFTDNYFDFILSTQVLYFLPTEKHIKKICQELKRVLKPNGIVFFTMISPKNYFIKNSKIKNKIRQTEFGANHRLADIKQSYYVVKNKAELKELFSDFKCLSMGYFDIRIMEGSNFHWIFVGQKIN